jgi:hypothetical protein
VTDEPSLATEFIDILVNLAFGANISQISPPVFISRRVRQFALLSTVLPLVLIPELLLPYTDEQLMEQIVIVTLTILAILQILMLRLRLTVIHRRISSYRRQSAILFLTAASFFDVGIFWTTVTGYFVGIAVAAIVAALGFAITHVRLPVVRVTTDEPFQ